MNQFIIVFLIILEMADGALNELNGAYATYMY